MFTRMHGHGHLAGLQHFDALYMVPVFQAFWIVFSVISGLVVYDESKDMTAGAAFMFTSVLLRCYLWDGSVRTLMLWVSSGCLSGLHAYVRFGTQTWRCSHCGWCVLTVATSRNQQASAC